MIFTPNFSAALSAQRGLRSIARARNTASALPSVIIASACSASVIRPTAAVRMSAWLRMASAKGTWKFGLGSIFALWMAPPDETSIRSTPSDLSSFANLTESFISQPPSAQSVAEMRTNSGVVVGIAARTAFVVSIRKRVLFS